jgi:hypothetical protein
MRNPIYKNLCITAGLLVLALLTGCSTTPQPDQSTGVNSVAVTETPAFTLNVHRNFGYGGGRQIKGNFGLAIVDDASQIASVTFLIDGQAMKTISAEPFSLTFETTDYAYGLHQLSAEVTDLQGRTYTTPAREYEFVTAEVERAAVVKILAPILGGTFGVILIAMLVQLTVLRKKGGAAVAPGTPRNYGLRGGAICPKCKRPFPIGLLTLNLLTQVYTRCSNCGKWSVVKRAGLEELRAAERAELEAEKPTLETSPKTRQQQLKDQLDDSRYTDR